MFTSNGFIAVNEAGVIINPGYGGRDQLLCEIAGTKYVMSAEPSFRAGDKKETVLHVSIRTAREKKDWWTVSPPLPLELQKEIQAYVSEGLIALGCKHCF